MAEYVKAFDNDIALEMTIQDIGKKVSDIFAWVAKAIRLAIKWLTEHLAKLRKVKPEKTDKDATPNSQAGAGAEVMRKEDPKVVYIEDLYDCGNELKGIVEDVKFCVNMLMKRPKPDHKVGKGYAERYAQDNELIADRMERCLNTLKKLDGIEKKTISLEIGETLKKELEELSALYEKYGRFYEMFVKKNQHVEAFMAGTINSFNLISNVGGQASVMIQKLYTVAN